MLARGRACEFARRANGSSLGLGMREAYQVNRFILYLLNFISIYVLG